MIMIGTSGYSFPNWKGTFYPQGLPERDQLEYYARFFPVVEINTTFYQIPTSRLFSGMQKRVPDDFTFWVKIHKSLTHDRQLELETCRKMISAVKPIEDSQQMAGFLAQFPWSFRNANESWERLFRLAGCFHPRELAVEFRHRSWDRPEIYEQLRSSGITYCIVDEPQLSNMMPPTIQLTSSTAYFRFHGRNSKNWWGKDAHLRYDYLYSAKELNEWVPKIKKMQKQARKVFVFFNNCHLGQAAQNANMLREMLGLSLPSPSGMLF